MCVNAYVVILIWRGPLLAYPLSVMSTVQVRTYMSAPRITD